MIKKPMALAVVVIIVIRTLSEKMLFSKACPYKNDEMADNQIIVNFSIVSPYAFLESISLINPLTKLPAGNRRFAVCFERVV